MSQVVLTLEDVLNSKAYEKGQTFFPSPSKIIDPFLNKVNDHVKEWRVSVKTNVEGAVDVVEKDGFEEVTRYTAYPRVALEGILNDEYQINFFDDTTQQNENHLKTVGLIYGLDVQNPVIKVYTGYLRALCMNLSVFNPSNIQSVGFDDSNFERVYEFIPGFLDNSHEDAEQYRLGYDDLVNKQYSGEELKQLVGALAFKCIPNSMNTAYNTMVRFMSSNKPVSKVPNYYYKKSKEYSKWELYNMMTASLSGMNSKSSLTRPNRVYEAYKLMKDLMSV